MGSSFDNEKDVEASSWSNGRIVQMPGLPVADDIPDEPLPSDTSPKVKSGTSISLLRRFTRSLKISGSLSNFSFFSASSLPKFSTWLPKEQRKRRATIIIVIVAMIALLALILGLSIGLTGKSHAAPAVNASHPAGTFTGDMTYYSTGLGACGMTSNDGQLVVALGASLYDQYNVGSNPNNNPLCGQTIRVNYGGRSVDLLVVDRCPGCDHSSIDVSPTAFGDLADRSLGRISVSWRFVN